MICAEWVPSSTHSIWQIARGANCPFNAGVDVMECDCINVFPKASTKRSNTRAVVISMIAFVGYVVSEFTFVL